MEHHDSQGKDFWTSMDSVFLNNDFLKDRGMY